MRLIALCLVVMCLTLSCLGADSIQYQPIQIISYNVFPQVSHEKVPHKYYNKYIYEGFSKLLEEVNLQSSAYFYMKQGQLSGQAAYDPTQFGGHSSKCRIYKTDLKLQQYRQLNIINRPSDISVAEQSDIDSGRIANVYTMHEGGSVQVSLVYLNLQSAMGGKFVDYENWANNMFLLQNLGTFKADIPVEQVPKLLTIGNRTYIISDTFLLEHKIHTQMQKSTQEPIQGYLGTKNIIKATEIRKQKPTDPQLFYVLSAKQLLIYQLTSERQVKQIGRLSNIPQDENAKLLAATQDEEWFYITAPDTLYVIDWRELNPLVYNAKLNGTCTQVEKFKTTLHLSCTYRKIIYIAEFFALGNIIQINRFYGGDDIQGRGVVKRLDLGKMAIMTDNQIKILGFSLNKNIILEQENPQPEYNFGIKYGMALFPLKSGTNKRSISFIVIKPDRITFALIQQTPPELYCEFPVDHVGATYQFLLQFNTTRCSTVKQEQDLFYGSLESVCQISVPITLHSKQVLLQSKHTNAIMIIVGVILVGFALLVLACVIKYNRSLEHRFEVMQKKLQKMKQGFDKKKFEEAQKRDM